MIKANLWVRIAAALLDLALFMPIYYAAIYLIARLTGGSRATMWDRNPILMSAALGNLLFLAYSSFDWIAGATPGKALLRMKILKADGASAARGTLAVRWAIKWSVRIFGLMDAAAAFTRPRMPMAKAGLAFFYHEPANFALARYLGEAALIAVAAGMLWTLKENGRSLQDWLTGTCVYRKALAPAKRGFEPVIGEREPVRVESLGSEA